MPTHRVVLATANPGKIRELRSLLPPNVELVSASELGIRLPPETGETFAENALLKARVAARESGLIALADDSGLVVDALGGRPGVRSARYADEQSDHAQNIARLLQELRDVPVSQRTARFRAVVAIVAPDGREAIVEGTVEGYIAEKPRGRSGFGYDPVFVPCGHDRTFAEMSLEEKNRLSHRAQALQRAVPILLDWLSCTGQAADNDDSS